LRKKHPREFYLTQLGLTENAIQAGGISNANGFNTTTRADFEGTAFN